MKIPGFNAEASLGPTVQKYRRRLLNVLEGKSFLNLQQTIYLDEVGMAELPLDEMDMAELPEDLEIQVKM